MARTSAPTSPPLQPKPKIRAFKALKQWIEDGRLASGERLPSEQALASSLRVARSAIRSALHQLEHDGLIQPEGIRGRIVSDTVRATQTVMNQTVVLVTESPDVPPAYQRATGWESYIWLGMGGAVREAGLHALTIHPSLFTDDQIHRLIADRPRGVILRRDAVLGRKGEAALDALRTAGVPIVLYGYESKLSGFDMVISDHAAGAYKLTKWLLEQGHSRILRIWPDTRGSDGKRPSWLVQRDVGFEKAMQERDIKPIPAINMLMIPVDSFDRAGFEASTRMYVGYLMEHLTGSNSIDAVMLASDGGTYATSAAVRHFNKIPGKDVLVVGYDRYYSDLAERVHEPTPPAATIDRQNVKIGQTLVRLMLDRIEGKLPPEPQLRVIEPQLVVVENEAR